MNTESDITKTTRYHINLFSDYGIRRNTQSDITKWSNIGGLSAAVAEAYCHLAMAYIDGNGAGVDIKKARCYLAVGESRKHRFCTFKYAEIKIEEHIVKNGGIDPSIHEELNKLAEMARLGVGEACVSLHFLLERYGQELQAQGWGCSKAYEITNKFMQALQLAYHYKPGEPYQTLVSALHDLGDLGSGTAYFQAGKILAMNEEFQGAVESYQQGAVKCLDRNCIRSFIVNTSGELQMEAIKWAKEKCPIPLAYFYEASILTTKALENKIDIGTPGNFTEIFEAYKEGLYQSITNGDLEDGLKVAEYLFDNSLMRRSDVRELVKWFLNEVRKSGISNQKLEARLTNLNIDFYNDIILNHGFKKEYILNSDNVIQIGGLDKIALDEDFLTELEFSLIEEYGRLTLRCATGDFCSLYTAMSSCFYQTEINPRIKLSQLDSPRLYFLAYACLRGAELVSGEEIKELKQELEKVIPKKNRDSIDSHIANEHERWNEISSRKTYVDWIGRGARYSQRLFDEINYSHDTPAGQFQPWRPVIESKAKPDQLALTWNQDVLSACPIDKDWILDPNSDARKEFQPAIEQTNHLSELAKAGRYKEAKHSYTCWKLTAVGTGVWNNKKFSYYFQRIDDSNQLAVIAREMLFRGNYEESEKIIDYLIYTELPPQGLLHHISAWLKYKQGKLSEAIIMLQDSEPAALAESLKLNRTNANILEYQLLLAELLLRDECLAQAADKIIKLKDICDKEQIYDVRISQLSEKIQLAHKQVTGQQVGLYQIAMSQMTNMLFTLSKNPIGILPQVPYFGVSELPPNNMDRYRCLFPK
jgi:hypothetical protein